MTGLRRVAAWVASVPAWGLVLAIQGYRRFISPLTPQTCRYYPSCSAYGAQAIRTHGAGKGTLLTGWRVLRCNPWTPGGVDHVPERGHWRAPAVDPREPLTDPVVATEAASEPGPESSSRPSEPRPLVGPLLPPSTGA